MISKNKVTKFDKFCNIIIIIQNKSKHMLLKLQINNFELYLCINTYINYYLILSFINYNQESMRIVFSNIIIV